MSDQKAEHKYELLYFAARGRGECLRLLLHFSKTPFTDTCVTGTDWAALKPKTPLGQMPILIEKVGTEEFQIPQSMAIARHIARQKNLCGATERDQVRADVLAEVIVDWKGAFAQVMREKEKAVEFASKRLGELLTILTKFLELSPSKNGFFVADTATYADILAFDLLDVLTCYKPNVLANQAKLSKFVEMMRAHENLKDYLASRRKADNAYTLD